MVRIDEKDIPCVICGNIFHSTHGAKYCGAACRREGNRRNGIRRYYELMGQRTIAEDSKPKGPSIDEVAKAARAAGMQYGDYVAKHGL